MSAAISVQAEYSVDEATEFSLIYGYPLLAYAKFALPILSSKYGTNTLDHGRQLATASFQSVVRVNADTIYTKATLDLSESDLIIQVPEVTDRYWVFPFYDLYGNNYANLGSVKNSSPGKYRIRFASHGGQEPGVKLCRKNERRCDKENHDCDGLQGIINAPTPYGIFVGRFLVRDNSSDLEAVHAIQNQTALFTVSAERHHLIPKLTVALLNDSLSSDVPTKIMQMTARFNPFNPPRDISDRAHVDRMLRRAGIHNGHFTPTGSNLTAVAKKAFQGVLTYASNPPMVVNLKNNWYGISPSAQGDYGTDYKERYYIAYFGYLGLVASEAIYPSYRDPTNGGSATLSLTPKQAYLITFSSKPPLEKDGFWSITAYNAEQYLVPNPLNRYSIGDRSNLTYPDGSLVYSSSSKNESFQILVQPADVEPPKNWTSNWLPAPAGGGEMSITFRLYAASSSATNGEWAYPVVKKVDAFTA
ncbi:hypothetical protein PHISCL_05109 [Aspergillus sclerotialis]|uniref:DUF1254 domain-containing protein n=1 Tax=Aspergillus sclerotialis TaxID=2070753 RepID=A0A3A2ZJS9_9EURO|nr:hypothetical protein PHISCL_05109 [Aspergillus sclerotialis]